MTRWCVLLILVQGTFNAIASPKTDSLIQVLVQAINNKDVSVKARLERIDEIKSRLSSLKEASTEEKFALYNAIYSEYKTFIYDSAFSYAHKLIKSAYQLRDSSKIGYARVQLGFILVSSGMFKETFDSLTSVSVRYLAITSRR